MENPEFEKAWKREFLNQSYRRNILPLILFVTVGTLFILVDFLSIENYPKYLLILRIFVSFFGAMGVVLGFLKKISGSAMASAYLLPMFAILSHMITVQEDINQIILLNAVCMILVILGLTTLVIKTKWWIFVISCIYGIYLTSSFLFNQIETLEFFRYGGYFLLLGILPVPILAAYRYRLLKDNFSLSYEVKKQKEKLEFYANNDQLTHAFNRRGGLKILQQAIHMAKRRSWCLTICYIDLDGLKKINDTNGHAAGDQLIATFAAVIKTHIRESDTICRLGGDEFLINFPNCNPNESKAIIERITLDLDEINASKRYPFQIEFSFGLSEYDIKKALSIDDFLHLADKEMYKNKKQKHG